MPTKRKKNTKTKTVETLTHTDEVRANIPTAELQPVMEDDDPVPVTYERNRDLDPHFVWRGKDEQDWSDLVVQAPPLFIQEKVHPKVLIDDLMRSAQSDRETPEEQLDLFCGFQRLAERGSQDGVLPARRQLVEPDDPRRQLAGDGIAGGARRVARKGAVHLHRSALRHQVQLQLPVVHHQPRCAGWESRGTSPASRSR